MRRLVLLLTVSCLGWPGVLRGWTQRAAASAEAAGFALGSWQRAPALEPTAETVGDSETRPADFSARPDLAASPGLGIQPEVEVLPAPVQATMKRRTASSPSSNASSANSMAPRRGLRVRSDTVLRLAKVRVIPEGTYVAPDQRRPGGMRLSGVGGLGVGLAEGDVLSHVGGAPVTSRSAVVTAVLQARARRASEISALFWRDGEPWRLVVEMPYLPESKTL